MAKLGQVEGPAGGGLFGGGLRTPMPTPPDCCVVVQEQKIFLTYSQVSRTGSGSNRSITLEYNGKAKKRTFKRCLAPGTYLEHVFNPMDMDSRPVLSEGGIGVRWKEYKTKVECKKGSKGPEYQFQCGDEMVAITGQMAGDDTPPDSGPAALCLFSLKWKDCIKPCGDCECELDSTNNISGKIVIKGEDVNLPVIGGLLNWFGDVAGNSTTSQFLDQLVSQINDQISGCGEPSCDCELTSAPMKSPHSAGLPPIPAVSQIKSFLTNLGTVAEVVRAADTGEINLPPNTSSRVCIK